MNDQSDATLSGIAAARWLGLIEEHTEFLATTLHTLVSDLDRAGIRVLGIPNTIPLRTEIEMLKAGMKRVSSEMSRDCDEHARLVA